MTDRCSLDNREQMNILARFSYDPVSMSRDKTLTSFGVKNVLQKLSKLAWEETLKTIPSSGSFKGAARFLSSRHITLRNGATTSIQNILILCKISFVGLENIADLFLAKFNYFPFFWPRRRLNFLMATFISSQKPEKSILNGTLVQLID